MLKTSKKWCTEYLSNLWIDLKQIKVEKNISIIFRLFNEIDWFQMSWKMGQICETFHLAATTIIVNHLDNDPSIRKDICLKFKLFFIDTSRSCEKSFSNEAMNSSLFWRFSIKDTVVHWNFFVVLPTEKNRLLFDHKHFKVSVSISL